MIQIRFFRDFMQIRASAEKEMIFILQYLLLNGFREFPFTIPEI